jgi:serine/threonine protein phosphatase 1
VLYPVAGFSTSVRMADHSGWLRRLVGQAAKPHAIPAGRRVYAVGDIHGRYDLLTALLERIWADANTGSNTLVFLGDYVDRGPASKDVVDHLLALRRPGWEIIKLRGNHEQLMLEFHRDPQVYQAWRSFGGAETLMSYGVRPPSFSDSKEVARAHEEFTARLPREHLTFLTGLPCSHTIGSYVFVHAGVRPGIPLDRQLPEDMLWIRDEFLCFDERMEKCVVHGHTPAEHPVLRSNRICVDTGAYATDCLTAVKLAGEGCTFLSTRETGNAR